METEAMVATFKWINDDKNINIIKQVENIKIITDSQNVLNIITHRNIPKDDAMIAAAMILNHEMKILSQNNKYPSNFIEVYCKITLRINNK